MSDPLAIRIHPADDVVLANKKYVELITGDGVSIGDPALRAGAVVEIAGLGSNFSGLYYIVRSTHSIGPGGYETGFSVRKNAIS